MHPSFAPYRKLKTERLINRKTDRNSLAVPISGLATTARRSPKISSKTWHVFQTRKCVRQHTTIHQQSTTTSPQNDHVEDARFAKTPAKTPLHHAHKKM